MPNWCSNTIVLKHKDPEMINRVIRGKKGFLMEFLPTPESLNNDSNVCDTTRNQNIQKYGASSWYEWNLTNWGTKWDFKFDTVEKVNPHEVKATFLSAWSPPVNAYEKLHDMGFEIEAFYFEPGMAFAGKWSGNADGCSDAYCEYGGATSKNIREYISEEIDECFGISEMMKEWE